MLNYHLTTSKLINCYYTKLRPFFIPLFSIILILSLFLSTSPLLSSISFVMFILLYHSSLSFSLLFFFFLSSLSFVILFFLQSLFFCSSSLLFIIVLSSSHSCHFHPPVSSYSFIIIVSFPSLSPSLSSLSSILLSLSFCLLSFYPSFSTFIDSSTFPLH